MRTITVQGVGSVRVKPDWIQISLSLEAGDMEYHRAVEQAGARIALLQKAVREAGFAQSDLKTTGFQVNTRYENQRDSKGTYRSVFAGFLCTYQLKLSFDFHTERLARVLGLLSASGAEPEIRIAFTVKEPAAVEEELLASAAENARRKAEVLCRAAGEKLGKLVQVDYHWGEDAFESPTRWGVDKEAAPMLASRAALPELEPEDIHASDTVTFRWEIRD